MAERTCDVCGTRYETKRPDSSKYCSARCRNRRARDAGPPPDADVVALPGAAAASVVSTTRAALDAAGRLDSYLAQAALAAAERLDASRVMNGYAATLKEYRDTMREAMADVEQRSDTADQLREAALRLIGS